MTPYLIVIPQSNYATDIQSGGHDCFQNKSFSPIPLGAFRSAVYTCFFSLHIKKPEWKLH